MKKTFPLQSTRHKPPQVIDAIKHEIRKYLKRERRKELPEDADFWDFDCQVGQDGPQRVAKVGEIIAHIDEASKQDWPSVYIEIIAKPGKRTHAPREASRDKSDAPAVDKVIEVTAAPADAHDDD